FVFSVTRGAEAGRYPANHGTKSHTTASGSSHRALLNVSETDITPPITLFRLRVHAVLLPDQDVNLGIPHPTVKPVTKNPYTKSRHCQHDNLSHRQTRSACRHRTNLWLDPANSGVPVRLEHGRVWIKPDPSAAHSGNPLIDFTQDDHVEPPTLHE